MRPTVRSGSPRRRARVATRMTLWRSLVGAASMAGSGENDRSRPRRVCASGRALRADLAGRAPRPVAGIASAAGTEIQATLYAGSPSLSTAPLELENGDQLVGTVDGKS